MTAINLLREKWYKGILLLEKDFDEFEEIEKQQIKDAFRNGDSFEGRATSKDAEQYYRENFKDKEL
jgi:hypothetical protein